MSINIPGILLAIVLIWWAVKLLSLATPFGIFVFATGIVWAVISLGLNGTITLRK